MDLILKLIEAMTPYGVYAYVVMLAILIACGFGLPLPEDVVLVSGGILAARDVVSFWNTVAVSMAGVLVGDGTVFVLGRVLGPRLKTWRIYQRFVAPREERIAGWFDRFGELIIFFARFMPGLRTPLFLSAGMYGVALWKFVALDGVAALISVPAWVYVGYLFGENLEALAVQLERLKLGVPASLAAAALLVVLVLWLKKRFGQAVSKF